MKSLLFAFLVLFLLQGCASEYAELQQDEHDRFLQAQASWELVPVNDTETKKVFTER